MADPQVVGESQFIRDIEKSAIDAFNEEHPYEQSFYNDVAGFVAAVNWEADGHWLAAFAAVHAVFFILIVFCRRVEIVQLATFVSICGVVMASEVVNAFLHEHWRDFATQDYFDEHGVFFSCLFSGPLLILGFLQLVLTLCYVKDLLVTVKRAELKHGPISELKEKAAASGKQAKIPSGKPKDD
eukprot:INCI14165.1.p1 GENE.INCI14165.1~~INCI14165.1.p1  ORF type:complete len:208 (-),score=39.03 INCI14165.1:193-744(-)